MKVTFPYEADNVDELSLEVGDIIEIIKDVSGCVQSIFDFEYT